MSGYTLIPPNLRGSLACELIRLAGAGLAPLKHRGFWQAAQLAGRVAPRGQQCVVKLAEGGQLQVDVQDHYWSRLLALSFAYEPEIMFALRGLPRDLRPVFLDCGANFGFWSVVLSGPSFGWTAVAVEASPTTFARLEQNRKLNGDRFVALNAAIFSERGRHVRIDTARDHHSAASISTEGAGASVVTTTIDDLVEHYAQSAQTPIIIKLDVEGVETEAIRGASAALGRNALLIYEDHGNEPTASVTAFVLGRSGLRVYFVTDAETVLPIPTTAAAQAVKTDKRKGYNFFAVRAGSELDRHFERLAGRSRAL